MANRFYITTPIYYVNDRPHIGHVYTTTIADIIARYHRLTGDDVFFLTGTDEHAAKVVDAATERGLTPQQWADRNAEVFETTFARLAITNDDFIRTTQDRHKTKVIEYIRQLLASGDVYVGEYQGWYDPGQEEYVPENKAAEYNYKSPISGKPLVRKSEKNDFFALSKYQDRLLQLIEHDNPTFIQPPARRQEVLSRIREGLNDVPISRAGERGWGIPVPDDPQQTIYVWIDALFNYRTAIDTPSRLAFWPADVHLIAKDILWFHAVIWPAMLMALDWPLPKRVYAHSFWISEGQKMSKSMGNFIDLERIDHYVETFSLDALRYFLATAGPMDTTDSDFAESRFIEVYNADLANTLGNCSSRVINMIHRYFNGLVPAPGPSLPGGEEHDQTAQQHAASARAAYERLNLHAAAAAGLDLVRAVDRYIDATEPFRLAKDPDQLPAVGTILYNCLEALRIASVVLWPILPAKMEELWSRIGCEAYTQALVQRAAGQYEQWTRWGCLDPGTAVEKKDPLFPRYQG